MLDLRKASWKPGSAGEVGGSLWARAEERPQRGWRFRGLTAVAKSNRCRPKRLLLWAKRSLKAKAASKFILA